MSFVVFNHLDNVLSWWANIATGPGSAGSAQTAPFRTRNSTTRSSCPQRSSRLHLAHQNTYVIPITTSRKTLTPPCPTSSGRVSGQPGRLLVRLWSALATSARRRDPGGGVRQLRSGAPMRGSRTSRTRRCSDGRRMDMPPTLSRPRTPSTRHTPRQKLRSPPLDRRRRSIVACATRTGLQPPFQRGNPPRNCVRGRRVASAPNPTEEPTSAPRNWCGPCGCCYEMGAMQLLGCGPCIHAVGRRSCPKCAESDYDPGAESSLAQPNREKSKQRCVVCSS